ncbi:MAG: pyridoxamine kinase [Ruminococcaceae bacterium]|nr:pyridoxamine kinase [Oscillospiraceae bacterium]
MAQNDLNKNRVIAVHDISCVGRCSLTVALPILSAAGLETSVIPTAVLSTHTGEFSGYTFRDLTDDIEPICEHWKSLGLGARSIYTGYLGSFRQLEIVEKLIADFKGDDTFVLVDPVMGDAGRLYSRIDEIFVGGMKKLCSMADMIVPNITEAAMLTDSEYIGHGYSKDYIKDLLKKLSLLGPRYSILSGVSFEDGKNGSAAYDRETGEFSFFFSDHVDGFYYGTGDVFASALLGAILNEKSVSESIKIAVDFTIGAIRRTYAAGTDKRYGVHFEGELPSYIKALGKL